MQSLGTIIVAIVQASLIVVVPMSVVMIDNYVRKRYPYIGARTLLKRDQLRLKLIVALAVVTGAILCL